MSDLFMPTIARSSTQGTYTNSTNASSKTADDKNIGYLTDSSADNLTLTMEDFLQLMIVQFQNQDIDNPASTSDMMNQLMQMSTIQSMATMTDATTMTYAASLVGKTVTIGEYSSGRGLEEIVGVVTGTGTYDGDQVIFVNGKSYKLSSIMAVGVLPDAEDDATGDGTTGTDGSTDSTEQPEGGDTV